RSTALLTALWKSGKTTLLSHLIKALGTTDSFCGQKIHPATTLYVSEENATLWCQRRDRLQLCDYVFFHIRPFMVRPSREQWLNYLIFLDDWIERRKVDLVILDTL